MTTLAPIRYRFSETESYTGDRRYVLRVKDLPSDEKPREKLIKNGPKSLTISELVAVVLGVGTKSEEVLTMSSRIMRQYGERAIVNENDAQRMAESLQIPVTKASQLIASFEMGRRFFENRSGKAVYVSTARQAFDYLKDMGQMKKEQLRGLYLNSRYQVIYEEVISVGSMTTNIVHPREVFQPAIEHGAVAVIIAHNHPSGRLEATFADNEVTERLLIASQILGIDLLDHLIIAGNKYKSIITEH